MIFFVLQKEKFSSMFKQLFSIQWNNEERMQVQKYLKISQFANISYSSEILCEKGQNITL